MIFKVLQKREFRTFMSLIIQKHTDRELQKKRESKMSKKWQQAFTSGKRDNTKMAATVK